MKVAKLLVNFYLITLHTVWWCFLSQRKEYFGSRFGERLENRLYLQRKCSPYFGSTEMFSLCDAENCSYDKTLPNHPYLPNVFVLFIDLSHFEVIEKGISILLDAG